MKEIITKAIFEQAKEERIHYLKRGLAVNKNMNYLSTVTGEETNSLDTAVDRLTYVVARSSGNSLLIVFVFSMKQGTRTLSKSEDARTILSQLQ